MIQIITALVLTLTALFAPVSPSQPASQPATFSLPPALTAQCEEDQPCWDCLTMGNHQCTTASPTTATATATAPALDAPNYQPTSPTVEDYSGTVEGDVAALPVGQPAQPTTTPNVWHAHTDTPAQPTAQPTQPTAWPTASQPQPTASQPQPAQPTSQPVAQPVPVQPAQPTAQPTASTSTVPTSPAQAGKVSAQSCDITGC